jgi:16S rRNA (guanine(527)-N(7))-methyltransferase RsmG
MERAEFDSDKKLFISWMSDNYKELSDGDRKRLLDYGELIIERGASLGLVSRKDLPRLFMRHLREVAAPAFVGLARPGSRVVDIGSGAGLPGIPLAILRPDLDIVLVEPRHRRAGFLERTVMQLGLKQTRVVMASLDAFVRSRPEPLFSVGVSRAVSWTPPMVKLLEEIMTPEGDFIRFGDPGLGLPGIRVVPIESESPRAIQIWPRSTWAELPNSR